MSMYSIVLQRISQRFGYVEVLSKGFEAICMFPVNLILYGSSTGGLCNLVFHIFLWSVNGHGGCLETQNILC